MNKFLEDKNIDYIFSLRQLLNYVGTTIEKFRGETSETQERVFNRLEANIMSNPKVKSVKDLVAILNEEFKEINLIKDNKIEIKFI